MRAKQLMEVGKLKFEGWLEPRFHAHKTALKRVDKTNSLWKSIKRHWLVVGEFEADIVLAFSVAIRYLFILIVLLFIWDAFNY